MITAADGETALEVHRQKREHIDLIILDLVMPGMGGSKCLQMLLKENPQAKVVVSSGFSPGMSTQRTMKAGASGFIKKPYDLMQMIEIFPEANTPLTPLSILYQGKIRQSVK